MDAQWRCSGTRKTSERYRGRHQEVFQVAHDLKIALHVEDDMDAMDLRSGVLGSLPTSLPARFPSDSVLAAVGEELRLSLIHHIQSADFMVSDSDTDHEVL